jgi:hypothetical protein
VQSVLADEQRIAQLDQRVIDLERIVFSLDHQLVVANATWQRSRAELVARLPALHRSLDSEQAELELAARALDRVVPLHKSGFATQTRLDQLATAKTVAANRVKTTTGTIASTQGAIDTLDDGHRQADALMSAQKERIKAEIAEVVRERSALAARLTRGSDDLRRSEAAERVRRAHEIEAASARINELDSEIAAIAARQHVTAPIGGRVLYRNETSSTLNGSLPLLVVAARHGFLMRVDLPRDEVPALRAQVASGNAFEVLIEDATARKLVEASVVRIDDNEIDQKRVTVVFGLDVPEDTLVRMALRNTTPRAHLRWTPPAYVVLQSRIAQTLGIGGSTRLAVPAAPTPAAAPVGMAKGEAPVRAEVKL